MESIFETFKKSVYNPAFYKSVADAPSSGAFRYYIKFSLILSLLMTVALGIFFVPQGVSFIKERAPDLVKTYYPKELVVNIENGVATANVQMPYFIPLKKVSGATESGVMQNILVIDTSAGFDKKKFEEYKTYALLTGTDIITRNDNGQITIQSLRGSPKVTINQDILLSWIMDVRSFIVWIVIGGIIVTFMAMVFGYLMYLIPLFLFTLIPIVISYVKKSPISYASAYKMSLYAIIPALALKTLLNTLGVFSMPAYFTFLVFMLVIALNMREQEQPKLFNN